MRHGTYTVRVPASGVPYVPCTVAPQEDRDAYPELFKLPKDCYEVILEKPLGIAFEENTDGGVVVDYLVEGSNAEKCGSIKAGDVLLATTAAMSIGPKVTLTLTLAQP